MYNYQLETVWGDNLVRLVPSTEAATRLERTPPPTTPPPPPPPPLSHDGIMMQTDVNIMTKVFTSSEAACQQFSHDAIDPNDPNEERINADERQGGEVYHYPKGRN